MFLLNWFIQLQDKANADASAATKTANSVKPKVCSTPTRSYKYLHINRARVVRERRRKITKRRRLYGRLRDKKRGSYQPCFTPSSWISRGCGNLMYPRKSLLIYILRYTPLLFLVFFFFFFASLFFFCFLCGNADLFYLCRYAILCSRIQPTHAARR